MLQLIYRSETADGTDLNVVQTLVKRASRKNRNLEITSVLLFTSSNFIQVLEGGKHVVMRIYEQIQKDTRHKDVDLLLCRPIEKRRFPYSSLQLVTTNANQLLPPLAVGGAAFADISSDAMCSAIAQEFARARRSPVIGFDDRRAARR